MQAILPDAENVEKPLVSLHCGALAALGSVLEASWSVLEASWRRLGAVLELLLLSWLVLVLLQLVRSYLGGLKRLVVVLEAFLTLLKASWSLIKPLENELCRHRKC